MLKHLFSPPPIGGAQEEPEPELEPEPEPEQPRRLNVRPFPFDAVDAARAARRALGSSCAFVCCVLTSRCAGPQI